MTWLRWPMAGWPRSLPLPEILPMSGVRSAPHCPAISSLPASGTRMRGRKSDCRLWRSQLFLRASQTHPRESGRSPLRAICPHGKTSSFLRPCRVFACRAGCRLAAARLPRAPARSWEPAVLPRKHPPFEFVYRRVPRQPDPAERRRPHRTCQRNLNLGFQFPATRVQRRP